MAEENFLSEHFDDFWIKRLLDEIDGPELHRLDGIGGRSVGSDNHYRCLGADGSDMTENFHPLHFGHARISSRSFFVS